MSAPHPRQPPEMDEPTPAEIDEILRVAERTLGSSWERFLESGDGHFPEHQGGTLSLRDATQYHANRRLIAIYRPTDRERETAAAWHDYCDEHGYPAGELCGADTEPDNTYPEHPVSEDGGSWPGLTWAQVRRHALGLEVRQEALF